MKQYKLIIIGAGSGGLAAAELAGQLGLKGVALVEAAPRLGGECLHTGCVPSKALLHAAKKVKILGERATGQDVAAAWQHVRCSIDIIEQDHDNAEHFRRQGVDVYSAQAKFIDAHSIELSDGQKLSGRNFLISTGSSPAIPSIDGLDSVKYYTNENIFNLEQTPESMVIIGGGPIGCELATAFAMLGVRVSLLNGGEQLLPREEKQAAECVQAAFRKLGVNVVNGAEVRGVKDGDGNTKVTYRLDEEAKEIAGASLLIAAGRKPNTDLSPPAAGVTFDKSGIGINQYLQTSVSHIFAVGDCTPSAKFTHLAATQASIAVRNMLFPYRQKSASYLEQVPAITFTSPEVGRIGLTREAAAKQGLEFTVRELGLNEIDRAVTDENTDGYIHVLLGKNGRIIGATVVADSAAELIAPLSLLYYHNRPLGDLTRAVMPYPTMSSSLSLLALANTTASAKRSSLLQYWLKLRGWR